MGLVDAGRREEGQETWEELGPEWEEGKSGG